MSLEGYGVYVVCLLYVTAAAAAVAVVAFVLFEPTFVGVLGQSTYFYLNSLSIT